MWLRLQARVLICGFLEGCRDEGLGVEAFRVFSSPAGQQARLSSSSGFRGSAVGSGALQGSYRRPTPPDPPPPMQGLRCWKCGSSLHGCTPSSRPPPSHTTLQVLKFKAAQSVQGFGFENPTLDFWDPAGKGRLN